MTFLLQWRALQVCQKTTEDIISKEPVWIRATMIDSLFSDPSTHNASLGVLYFTGGDGYVGCGCGCGCTLAERNVHSMACGCSTWGVLKLHFKALGRASCSHATYSPGRV